MKLVIAHLTRMQAGFCCAAGIEIGTSNHVRCVIEEGRLPIELLAVHGGPFDMARVVEFEGARPRLDPPHTEDRVVDPASIRSIPNTSPTWFWRLLYSQSEESLTSLFGQELERVGPRSCATREGHGRTSLGVLRPLSELELTIKERGNGAQPRMKMSGGAQVRMKMRDGRLKLSVSVSDIRFYQEDHVTPNPQAVELVNGAIESGIDVLFSVGLTRAFAGYHWLQVNNVHIESDPAWRLGSLPSV